MSDLFNKSEVSLEEENARLREKIAVLQSQVENADVNLEQQRMSLTALHDKKIAAKNKEIAYWISETEAWMASCPLVTGRTINEAHASLGKVYRHKVDADMEIGVVDVNMAKETIMSLISARNGLATELDHYRHVAEKEEAVFAVSDRDKFRNAGRAMRDRLDWAIKVFESNGDLTKLPWHTADDWMPHAKSAVAEFDKLPKDPKDEQPTYTKNQRLLQHGRPGRVL